MDWRTLFTLQHHQVHSSALAGDDTDVHVPDILLRDMSDEQLRLSPRDDQSSVGWLLWHMARCEDVVTGAVLSSSGQVLDDGWGLRMHVPRCDIGPGMTSTEVRELSQTIDIDALLEYRVTAGRRTKELVGELGDRSLDEPVTPDNVETLRALETFGAHAGWAGEYWQTRRGHHGANDDRCAVDAVTTGGLNPGRDGDATARRSAAGTTTIVRGAGLVPRRPMSKDWAGGPASTTTAPSP